MWLDTSPYLYVNATMESALVSQEFGPNARLFDSMFGMVDKMVSFEICVLLTKRPSSWSPSEAKFIV